MRHDWKLGESEPLVECHWNPEVILMEYDGPQMVTVVRDGMRCLAEAVDGLPYPANIARWIECPLSDEDLAELEVRTLDWFTFFRRAPRVRVIDYHEGWMVPVYCWTINGSQLPDSAIPDPGVYWPSYLGTLKEVMRGN